MLFFQFVRLPNHLSQMHSGASSGEMTHHPLLGKEKQSPDLVLIVPALSNDEIQRPPTTTTAQFPDQETVLISHFSSVNR